MSIPIITVTNQPERAKLLIESAQKNGWEIYVIQAEWNGFGTKLISVYNFLKEHPAIHSFVFADAHDVLVLGTPREFAEKIYEYSLGEWFFFASAEKGLWPPILTPFRSKYVQFEHGFNYINSGLYAAKSEYFKWLYEKYAPFYEIDDQYWLNICYLLERNIPMNYSQNIFNSHSFIAEGEYTYHYDKKRIEIMGNQPIFLHFNGSGGKVPQEIQNLLAV